MWVLWVGREDDSRNNSACTQSWKTLGSQYFTIKYNKSWALPDELKTRWDSGEAMTVKHHRVKGNDANLIHFEKCCTKKNWTHKHTWWHQWEHVFSWMRHSWSQMQTSVWQTRQGPAHTNIHLFHQLTGPEAVRASPTQMSVCDDISNRRHPCFVEEWLILELELRCKDKLRNSSCW